MEKRPEFSKEELVEYLKANNFRTRSQLRQGRKSGEPTDDDYFKCFGNWQKAKDLVFGLEESDRFFGYDPYSKEYHIKCVVELGLWTREDYFEARRRCPKDIPSIFYINRVWKSYRILKDEASKHSFARAIDGYRKLRNRFGRKPTREECRMAGVYLDEAIRFFDTTKKFNAYMNSLEALQ